MLGFQKVIMSFSKSLPLGIKIELFYSYLLYNLFFNDQKERDLLKRLLLF